MRFDEFSRVTFDGWNGFFRYLSANSDQIESTGVPLFPTQLYLFQTRTHFGFELVGASNKPVLLNKRILKLATTRDYFNIFPHDSEDDEVVISIGAKGCRLQNLCLSHDDALALATKRFPIIDAFQTKLVRQNGHGPLVHLSAAADEIVFSNCLLLNSNGSAARIKRIVLSVFVLKGKTKREYSEFLQGVYSDRETNKLLGVVTVGSGRAHVEIAGQLQSLFLGRGVHETSIGDFLNDHGAIIKRSFNTESFVYEPFLKWVQHDGSVGDNAINPDLLIRRSDGFFDIVDLKLAGLAKKKLTKGKRSRRRFVDYVNEGLAQLANYEFYFTFAENAAFALEKYGVSVSKPRLILVVGNAENIDVSEVNEALRTHGDRRFSIIDWDSLISSYLEHPAGGTPSA